MKKLIIFLAMLFLSCGETIIAPPDVYYLLTDGDLATYEVGHIQLQFNFAAITGKEIMVINGNDRAIGVYITIEGNDAVVVFSDSWIGGLKSHTQEAVFYEDERLYVRIVVYKSLGGAIQTFIASLGEGFLDKLNDTWIETEYEQIIVLQR